MANVEFGTGKTVIILSIVVACFAMLWPRIFYPMIMAFSNKRMDTDNGNGCCDVIFETDINAIKIMTEMCGTILNRQEDFNPKSFQVFQQGKLSKEVINTCRSEVMKVCGIDIAEFLSKREKLGHSYKHMLDEVRSFNISVCLRHHFGINPGLLGAPRRMRIWGPSTSRHLRQERPLHFHPEVIHPALREKGRAIPQSQAPTKDPTSRAIPMPGMRPPMGGAGHVVPPPKTGGTMGIVMPLYTVGIVIFFVYTIMKVFMKKSNGNEETKEFKSDPEFRRVVFSEDYSNGCAARIKENEMRIRKKQQSMPILRRHSGVKDHTTRLGRIERDTRDIEIDHLRKRLEETEKAMERIVAQMETVPTEILNQAQLKTAGILKSGPLTSAITGLLAEFDQHLNKGRDTQTQYKTELKDKRDLEEFCAEEVKAVKKEAAPSEQVDITNKESLCVGNGRAVDHEESLENSDSNRAKAKIKVVGLEMMAECEGGQKWSGPAIPNLGVGGSSRSATPIPPPHTPEPQNIFLEGSLPQQSQLLVTDSKTQAVTLKDMGEPEPPVILSSKMTLSLISLDAAAPEENVHHDHTLSQTENQVDMKSDDDNFGNVDSTLLDVDSDLIDETGHNEPETSDVHEQEGIESENASKEVNEVAEENPSANYTAATISEEAEAGLVTGLEDTAADVSNLDGLDLVEDQEELQHEDVKLWNGSEKDAEEAQEQEEFHSEDNEEEN